MLILYLHQQTAILSLILQVNTNSLMLQKTGFFFHLKHNPIQTFHKNFQRFTVNRPKYEAPKFYSGYQNRKSDANTKSAINVTTGSVPRPAPSKKI